MRLLGTVRPQFLMLTPACVVLGVSTAIHSGTRISWLEIIFVLPGATLAHVAVNVFNEFHDFRSGLDSHTRRTPFSGGSGTLQAHPGLAGAAVTVGIAARSAACFRR
jgi:1,4-dihydroxy-2-naphthoate octaprenyltransferase